MDIAKEYSVVHESSGCHDGSVVHEDSVCHEDATIKDDSLIYKDSVVHEGSVCYDNSSVHDDSLDDSFIECYGTTFFDNDSIVAREDLMDYDYIDSTSTDIVNIYKYYKTVLVYGTCCSVPSFILLFVICLSSVGHLGGISNTQPSIKVTCLNMTMEELDFIRLLTSDEFFTTFSDPTDDKLKPLMYSINDEERQYLIRSIVSTVLVAEHKYESLQYLDYYVDEINQYRNGCCCSERYCQFGKNLREEPLWTNLFMKNTDVFFNNYAYIAKSFYDSYIIIIFRRCLAANNDKYSYFRSLFNKLSGDWLLYILRQRLMQFLEVTIKCCQFDNS